LNRFISFSPSRKTTAALGFESDRHLPLSTEGDFEKFQAPAKVRANALDGIEQGAARWQ
jgi:hypothetical protein